MRGSLVVIALFAGCVPYSTAPDQVGLHVNKLTGLEKRTYDPGATYFFAPFITDWYVFNTRTVALEMTLKGGEAEDVEFKTRDGNDVAVDVTVMYHIDPTKAADLLTKVGRSDQEIREVLVRPLARAIPRDALNGLTSEEIYTSKKFDAAREAVDKLNAQLMPYGVIVESVNLGDHRFHAEYQKAINDKKVFDQEVNTNRSAAENARREWEANLERTRGDVEQSIATQKGEAEQSNLEADAYYYSKQKEAEAILAEKEAHAKGIRKLKEAMAGSGGRTRIKMKIAEALRGKRIVVVPSSSGSGISINKLDVNELVRQAVVQEATTP